VRHDALSSAGQASASSSMAHASSRGVFETSSSSAAAWFNASSSHGGVLLARHPARTNDDPIHAIRRTRRS
jgi:hypothetical protein